MDCKAWTTLRLSMVKGLLPGMVVKWRVPVLCKRQAEVVFFFFLCIGAWCITFPSFSLWTKRYYQSILYSLNKKATHCTFSGQQHMRNIYFVYKYILYIFLITLLNIIGKAFGKLINRRFVSHLEEGNHLNPHQYGFRKGRGCESSLALTYEFVSRHKTRADNFRVSVVSTDISGAFDRVLHERLMILFHCLDLHPLFYKIAL